MVKVESQADALVVTLNRPDIHNAFNEHVIAHLTDIFTNEVPRASSAKCVVLTGTGKSFSAGADLAWMQKMVAYSKAENLHDSHRLFDMFHAIYKYVTRRRRLLASHTTHRYGDCCCCCIVRSCPLPVIGRINGAGLGGGAGLVATCDIAIASHEALFGFTEVQLGLIPAVISPFVVRKIGASAASRYFLTGERFDAATAKSIGIVLNMASANHRLATTHTSSSPCGSLPSCS